MPKRDRDPDQPGNHQEQFVAALIEAKEAKDKVIAAHEVRIEELKDRVEEKCHEIRELNHRLGLVNVQESVIALIQDTCYDAYHYDTFETPPPNTITAQEQYICKFAEWFLKNRSSDLRPTSIAVLKIYQKNQHCIFKFLSKMHHEYCKPEHMREAVEKLVPSQDREILLEFVTLLMNTTEVYVSVVINGNTLSSTNVATTLRKEGLDWTVDGLKKAVLKEFPNKLKEKDSCDLTVCAPGEAKGNATTEMDQKLETAAFEKPYHIHVE